MWIALVVLLVLVALMFGIPHWAAYSAVHEHRTYMLERQKRRGDHMFHSDTAWVAAHQRANRKLRFLPFKVSITKIRKMMGGM